MDRAEFWNRRWRDYTGTCLDRCIRLWVPSSNSPRRLGAIGKEVGDSRVFEREMLLERQREGIAKAKSEVPIKDANPSKRSVGTVFSSWLPKAQPALSLPQS